MKKIDETRINKDLLELVFEIDTAPSMVHGREEAMEDVLKRYEEKKRKVLETVAKIQDSLDYLRLSVKCLLFDLEATRRENDQLRKMLADPYNPAGPGDDEQPA